MGIKMKSNKMLDKAFKQLDKNFNKKLKAATIRYRHHLEELEKKLIGHIKNQEKKEKK